MSYVYEDLSPKQFEELIVFVCRRLFGQAVQSFADGKDGGRDAKFHGQAEKWPSQAQGWNGKVVIQAKHTLGLNKSYSDTDFYSEKSQNTVLGKEMPRVKAMISDNELQFYFLVSNRKLTGIMQPKLVKHISKETGLDEQNISVLGVEFLEMFLRDNSDIPKLVSLNPFDSPLLIDPSDLSDIIEALHENISNKITTSHVSEIFDRVSYEAKNKLNNMTEDYAEDLRKKYLKNSDQIRRFLSLPENTDVLQKYESVVADFNLKILAKRKDHNTFDEVIERLYEVLVQRDSLLGRNKMLTRSMLFYMYWNCDLGKNHENS